MAFDDAHPGDRAGSGDGPPAAEPPTEVHEQADSTDRASRADQADQVDQGEHADRVAPPLVGAGAAEVVRALDDGAVIAVPTVGRYCLAVRTGAPRGEARLAALAADPEGPHFAVGRQDDVRALTSRWSDEVRRLLERCWPGPVEVFLPRAGAAPTATDAGGHDEAESGVGAVTVGMPEERALRKLCREHGPWRTVPLSLSEAAQVAHAFDAADVACVVDGGRREGEPPTLVDATVSPVRVIREGALPTQFIDATMAMGGRRRWFFRSRSRD